MKKRFKDFLGKEENARLIINFFSLSGLNFINYFFPLIIIPYLTRILGVEKYGLYAFSSALIQYLVLIVNYGFDYSATKYIALNRDNRKLIGEILLGLTLFRVILSTLSTFLMVILINSLIFFKGEYYLYLFGIGILFGNALTPIWLFQGMEQMKYVTLINFISKFISTLLIFIVIKQPSDYIYVNLLMSIGSIVAGILSLLLAFKFFELKITIPNKKYILEQIKEGWPLFLSTVFMNFYRESNTLILGLITNYSMVGYYAAAEKIIKAIQSFIAPLSRAIYPYFGRKLNYSNNRKQALKKFIQFNKYYGITLIIIMILLYSISYDLIVLFLGKNYLSSIKCLQILSLIIFFGGLNYTLGIVGMVNLGHEKTFTLFVFLAGITNIILCFIFSKLFGIIGACFAIVAAEIILFLLIVFFLSKIYTNSYE